MLLHVFAGAIRVLESMTRPSPFAEPTATPQNKVGYIGVEDNLFSLRKVSTPPEEEREEERGGPGPQWDDAEEEVDERTMRVAMFIACS